MSLQNAIFNGESKTIEFKLELPSGVALSKTVVAFSNTGGGKLIIGVSDDGQIVGIDSSVDIFELQDKLISIIYDTCYPTILPDVYTTTLENKVLVVVEVFRGNLLPYYLKKYGKDEGVYIRVGATNRKASIENIMELERQRVNISFDQEVNRHVPFSTLNLSLLSDRFEKLGKVCDLNTLKNLKLVVEEGSEFFPTNGLLIILGELEHVTLKCSRFKGTTMDVFIDRKEYDGDVFSQLERAEGFIKNHILLSGQIKGLQRDDQYEIPMEAVRESLVNAMLHRDYANFGRDIKIGIYDDVVHIVSPGAFPSTLTQADIEEGRSEIRNRVLARVFKELNYIEQWGSGVRRIKASCKARGLKEPEILEKGDFVSVRLYREHAEDVNFRIDQVTLTFQEEQVVDYLAGSVGLIKTNDIKVLLDVQERRARTILKELTKKGVVVKRGNASLTCYELVARGEK